MTDIPEKKDLLPVIIADRSPEETHHYNQYYTPTTVERIIEEHLQGKSLLAISKMESMPSYPTLLRWFKNKPEFHDQIIAARKTRALYFEEMAERAVDEELASGTKDRAATARVRMDLYKWRSEVNDPATYGKKTTIQGDKDRPVIFQINTGVPKSEHERVIELDSTGLVKEVIAQKVITDDHDTTSEASGDYPEEVQEEESPG